jgi:hypothetical protein
MRLFKIMKKQKNAVKEVRGKAGKTKKPPSVGRRPFFEC